MTQLKQEEAAHPAMSQSMWRYVVPNVGLGRGEENVIPFESNTVPTLQPLLPS